MCFVIHTLRSLDCKRTILFQFLFWCLVPFGASSSIRHGRTSEEREVIFLLFLNSLVTRHGSFFWAVFTLNIWRVSLKLRCGLGSPGAGRIGTWCCVAPRGCCTQLALCLWKSGLTSRFLSTNQNLIATILETFWGAFKSFKSEGSAPAAAELF